MREMKIISRMDLWLEIKENYLSALQLKARYGLLF